MLTNNDDHDPDVLHAAAGRDQRLTISVEEAGHLLGISRGLAYALVSRGDIASIRLGRRIVVPRRALDHYSTSPTMPHRPRQRR